VETIATTVALLARDPQRTGLLLDFDGSLSPIVLRPEDAVLLPGTADVLAAIAQHLALVAVVSGRPVDFLQEHVAAPGVQLVGQYGLERVDDGRVVVDERALRYAEAVAAAAEEAERRWPELLIERKGRIAVGLHWRAAPTAGATLSDDIETLAQRHGLALHSGKMSRELRPPVSVDKGSVVEQLLQGTAVGVFAGDDAGDLPAFAALDRMQADHRLARALRIAVSSTEALPAVLASADLIVDGPEGLRVLLDKLAAALPT
jgi:trehalose 6-phosphate phosphatase